jgi:hypothetical protein
MDARRSLSVFVWAFICTSVGFGAGFLLRGQLSPDTARWEILAQAYEILQQHGLKEAPPGSSLEYGMIRGMLQAYDDPYTIFVEPAQHELETNTLEGSFGGIGVRPHRLGLVSDADGAIVALAVAAALARMRARGDRLRGDVFVRTHISPASPIVAHEPAPFVDVPVDRTALARAEVDAEMAAILSIDATRANRIVKARGFAITGTVKEGYLLRPTVPMLDIYERVAGHAPVLVPLFTQDITPPRNGVHHINSIMQPATLTTAPVIGIALVSPVVIGGASTGVNDEHDLAMTARFVIEVAKEFAAGTLPFYYEDEFRRLVELYGPLAHLSAAGGS